MSCRTARNAMVAARDGELGARGRRALDRHLDRCGACRAERVAFEGVLGALEQLPFDAEVPARLEQDVMRRVRILAEDEPAPGPGWARVVAPMLATTAVVALAVVGVRSDGGSHVAAKTSVAVATPARATAGQTAIARRAKTRAPAEPPAALASRPDLFMDLPMLREFDKIQHFDAIAGTDDDEASPSNG